MSKCLWTKDAYRKAEEYLRGDFAQHPECSALLRTTWTAFTDGAEVPEDLGDHKFTVLFAVRKWILGVVDTMPAFREALREVQRWNLVEEHTRRAEEIAREDPAQREDLLKKHNANKACCTEKRYAGWWLTAAYLEARERVLSHEARTPLSCSMPPLLLRLIQRAVALIRRPLLDDFRPLDVRSDELSTGGVLWGAGVPDSLLVALTCGVERFRIDGDRAVLREFLDALDPPLLGRTFRVLHAIRFRLHTTTTPLPERWRAAHEQGFRDAWEIEKDEPLPAHVGTLMVCPGCFGIGVVPDGTAYLAQHTALDMQREEHAQVLAMERKASAAAAATNTEDTEMKTEEIADQDGSDRPGTPVQNGEEEEDVDQGLDEKHKESGAQEIQRLETLCKEVCERLGRPLPHVRHIPATVGDECVYDPYTCSMYCPRNTLRMDSDSSETSNALPTCNEPLVEVDLKGHILALRQRSAVVPAARAVWCPTPGCLRLTLLCTSGTPFSTMAEDMFRCTGCAWEQSRLRVASRRRKDASKSEGSDRKEREEEEEEEDDDWELAAAAAEDLSNDTEDVRAISWDIVRIPLASKETVNTAFPTVEADLKRIVRAEGVPRWARQLERIRFSDQPQSDRTCKWCSENAPLLHLLSVHPNCEGRVCLGCAQVLRKSVHSKTGTRKAGEMSERALRKMLRRRIPSGFK